jgi:hypothetical protein
LEDEDVILILKYIGKGPVPVSNVVLHDALRRLVPTRVEQIMNRFGQKYFDDGVAKGQASALSRLLEKRFGAVPGGIRERISSADVASLEGWLERVLDAPDLQSVFGSN